ncbi:uncharacterized protein TRIADDRAFT_31828, partial [Trichoplax adhaerens]
ASSSVLTHMKSTYKGKVSQAITNLKAGNNQLECKREKIFLGHRDGIWEVKCTDYANNAILGTASADHTACIWDIESGQRLIQYQGHEGSVNSIRFHENEPLVCTGSGDSSAHIWRINLGNFHDFISTGNLNTDEDLMNNNYEGTQIRSADSSSGYVIRNSILQLRDHSGVVTTADWLLDGDQIVTASWDRTAKLWDVHTGMVIQTLTGHEEDITYAATHPTQNLLVTSSKDTTFRLWDFRSSSIHSVNVFQGHSNTVTSCVFAKDKIVSGSDDRTVKVWDLKNMRSPSATMRLDSAVNKLSVSNNVIAIPHDNRHIRLYDLNGNRIARLPRSNGQGHKRMVCCTAWCEDDNAPCNLFSAGFDRKVIGWNIDMQNGNS